MRALAVLVLASCFAAGSRAQVHSYLFDLSSPRGPFAAGDTSAAAGDLDADGVGDVVLAQLGRTIGQPNEIRACSGRDGRVLWTMLHGVAGELFGSALDAGRDSNRDGVGDVVAGFGAGAPATGPSYVLVLSGRDGTILRRIDVFDPSRTPSAFGFQLCGLSDTDGDGYGELAISDPYWTSPGAGSVDRAGKVWVVSGRTGRPLWSMTGPLFEQACLGTALNRAGDVDGDSQEDLLLSAPSFLGLSPCTVLLISGRTFQVLRALTKPAGSGFGMSGNGAGDLDRDGRADVVIVDRLGMAEAFSGRTGAALWSVTGPAQPFLGADVVAGAGDVDDDGWPDVVHAERLLSGRDGTVIARFVPRSHAVVVPVSAMGDINGDGRADVLGGAYVYSGADLPLFSPTHTLSAASGGAQDLVVQPRGHDGKFYLVLGSLSGTRPGLTFAGRTVPLNLDAWLLATLYFPNSGPFVNTFGTVTSTPALARLVVPPGAAIDLAGQTLWHAYAVIHPVYGAFDLVSNAVPLALLP